MTDFEIESAKRIVLKNFEDWIFSNPQHTFTGRSGDIKQWTPFIKEIFSKRGIQCTKEDLRADFELSDTIITAVSHKLYQSIDTSRDNVVDFSLEKIRTKLEMGSRKFYRELKNGVFFSQRVLERMYKRIAKWHVQELGDRESGLHYDRNDPSARAKLYYYQDALRKIISLKGFKSNNIRSKSFRRIVW